MRSDSTHQSGRLGVHEAMAAFTRIGWGPIENSTQDIGTDLIIFARDHRQFDRGQLVGAQVKGGPSYFERRTVVDGRAGWWYAEPGVDHFDSWVRHALPHLIVLVDLDLGHAYWQHVTADAVHSTGEGAKVFVPEQQTVDEHHLDDLLWVAAGTSAPAPITISPGRKLQTALVAPFALVPALSQTVPADLPPEEFIAALLSGEPLAGLDVWRGPRRSTWVHRLALELREWMSGARTPDFASLAAVARRRDRRTAALILHTAYLRDRERHREVVDVLNPEVASDRHDPADHAWLLLQRARSHFELCLYDEASRDALAAVRALGPVESNHVVELAIARSAAWLAFQLSGPHDALHSPLPSADDKVFSWRQRRLAEVMGDAVDAGWDDWTDRRKVILAPGTRVARMSFFAEMNADLVGDPFSWKHALELRSKLELMRAEQPRRVATLIDMLRRSGDTQALAGALQRYERAGPVEPVAQALEYLAPIVWSRTSAAATVRMLQLTAQHYLDPRAIRPLLLEIAESLTSPDDASPLETVPTNERWRLLGKLLRICAAPGAHRRVADLLLQTGDSAYGVDGAAEALSVEKLRPAQVRRLRAMALQNNGALGSALLGALARAGDSSIVRSLVDRANNGDLLALDELTMIRWRPQEGVLDEHAVVANLAAKVDARTTDASRGAYSLGGDDYGRALALTNIRFPDASNWQALIELLTSKQVQEADKVGALRVLVDKIEHVPPDVVRQLISDGVPAARIRPSAFHESARGAVTALRVVADIESNRAELDALRLLNGTEDEQADLARLLGLGYVSSLRPTLVVLLQSDSARTIGAAAAAVGRLARIDADPLIDDLIATVAVLDRVVAPYRYLEGLVESAEPLTAPRRDATLVLRDHPSAVVRWALTQVIDKGL